MFEYWMLVIPWFVYISKEKNPHRSCVYCLFTFGILSQFSVLVVWFESMANNKDLNLIHHPPPPIACVFKLPWVGSRKPIFCTNQKKSLLISGILNQCFRFWHLDSFANNMVFHLSSMEVTTIRTMKSKIKLDSYQTCNPQNSYIQVSHWLSQYTSAKSLSNDFPLYNFCARFP